MSASESGRMNETGKRRGRGRVNVPMICELLAKNFFLEHISMYKECVSIERLRN